MFHKDDKVGPYILVKKLGRGATGEVWLAEMRGDIATTKVALKLFPIEDRPDREPIKQEAGLWVTAGCHRNILPIIEATIYEDQIVLVSEYVPDGSLESWLKKNNGKAPSIKVAVAMITEILSGIKHLHSLQIAHRDLKPENILLKGDTPVITDFGLAKVMRTNTNTFSIAGTEMYMSPEAYDGKYSEQSDLWSTGVIFYRMLTGKMPFEQIMTILHSDPDPLPDSIPEIIKQVVSKALQKDLTQRYLTADKVLTDLNQLDFSIQGKNHQLAVVTVATELDQQQPPTSSFISQDALKMLSVSLKKYLVNDQYKIERKRSGGKSTFKNQDSMLIKQP